MGLDVDVAVQSVTSSARRCVVFILLLECVDELGWCEMLESGVQKGVEKLSDWYLNVIV
jgi:hypothetical protein